MKFKLGKTDEGSLVEGNDLPTVDGSFRVGQTAKWTNNPLHLKGTADGKNYVLIGWTADGELLTYLFKDTKPAIELNTDSYTFTAVGDVTLYAVWALDENNDGKPDYEEKFSIVYVNEAGALKAGESLPAEDDNSGEKYAKAQNYKT